MRERAQSSDSLGERAYQQIRNRILRGEFPLGAALSRRELARELGMSFVPVSEALQHLERDGLVESAPRAGTRVRMPTPDDIRERYMLREALECQAARLFVELAGDDEKAELVAMGRRVDQLYSFLPDADHEFAYSAHAYHMAFHMRIAEASRCKLLRDAIERDQVLIFNCLFDTAAHQRSFPSHSELTAALTGGEVMEADVGMRRHIRFGLDRVLAGIRAPAAPNSWRRRKRLPEQELELVGARDGGQVYIDPKAGS
jgi:DNA-binding GntR family transcriptional regulator